MDTIDLGRQLLDKQLLDSEGQPCGKVDDLVFDVEGSGRPVMTSILVGPGALGDVLPGWPGRVMRAVWKRLHPNKDPQPIAIPWADVERVDYAVHLTVQREEAGLTVSEDWARELIISKIPGAS